MSSRAEIEVFKNSLQNALNRHQQLRSKIDELQKEIAVLENQEIPTYRRKLESLGEDIPETVNSVTLLRGRQVGPVAVESLRKLGGQAHYVDVRKNIEERGFEISGQDEKSRNDRVWNQLSAQQEVKNIGRGVFRLEIDN